MLRHVFIDWCLLLQHGGRVFGVPLSALVGLDEPLPVFLENLFSTIEIHGLYTEGLYRKTGAAATVRQLEASLDAGE